MAEHTPTPWEAQTFGEGEDGIGIIGLPLNGLVAWASMLPAELGANDPSRAQANAAFIVKAVNNHDLFVSVLEKINQVSHKDSLTADERLEDIRAVVKAMLDRVGGTRE